MKQEIKDDFPEYTEQELDEMIAEIDRDMEKLIKNPSSSTDWIVNRWKRTKQKLEQLRKTVKK